MNNTMNDAKLAALIQSMSPILAATTADAEPPALSVESDVSASEVKTKRDNRCNCCNKKLALSDFACGKCKIRYCGTHRLPEAHQCSHDFRAAGAEQLKQQLTRVVADKIEHI